MSCEPHNELHLLRKNSRYPIVRGLCGPQTDVVGKRTVPAPAGDQSLILRSVTSQFIDRSVFGSWWSPTNMSHQHLTTFDPRGNMRCTLKRWEPLFLSQVWECAWTEIKINVRFKCCNSGCGRFASEKPLPVQLDRSWTGPWRSGQNKLKKLSAFQCPANHLFADGTH